MLCAIFFYYDDCNTRCFGDFASAPGALRVWGMNCCAEDVDLYAVLLLNIYIKVKVMCVLFSRYISNRYDISLNMLDT